jgi:Kef-type K+ transport system membrane component KefB
VISHADGVAPVLLALAVILVAAKLGGDIAERFGQPAVLGELLAGIILGNVQLPDGLGLRWIAQTAPIDLLAQLGVILLLFEVGLESTIGDMRRVGFRAFVVAVLGVVPWALGWWVSALMLPARGSYTHVYIGATLTATSVGITAPPR